LRKIIASLVRQEKTADEAEAYDKKTGKRNYLFLLFFDSDNKATNITEIFNGFSQRSITTSERTFIFGIIRKGQFSRVL